MGEVRVIGGRYTIERLIGQGGIGQVFLGQDQQTGQLVAVKALQPRIVQDEPRLLERFRREGQALKELDHPNIVKMLAVLEEDGHHYLVMEYVGGGSLYDLLVREGKLPLEVALRVALDLSDALTRAHRLDIIHRDIKPANVLLAEDGTPRLTDFGAARVGKLEPLTATGSVLGTVSYLSPEACLGQPVDARADIWSFGILLLEMLTGKRPYSKGETMATIMAILKEPLPDLVTLLPEAPPRLVNLLYKMLEKDLNRRIASMRQVGAELEAILGQTDSAGRQALDLIYRMLEKNTSASMREVEARLGTSIPRGAAPDPAETTRPQRLNVAQFEPQATVEPPALAPTSPDPSLRRSVRFRRAWIIGAVVLLIILAALVVVILT